MSHQLPAGFKFYGAVAKPATGNAPATNWLPPLGYDGFRWNAAHKSLTFRGKLAKAFVGKKVLVAVDGARIAFKLVSRQTQAKSAYLVYGNLAKTGKTPVQLSQTFKYLSDQTIPTGSFRAELVEDEWWVADLGRPMSDQEVLIARRIQSAPAPTVEVARPLFAASPVRSLILPAISAALDNRGWVTDLTTERLKVATPDLQVAITVLPDGRFELDALGGKGVVPIDLVEATRLLIDICDVTGISLLEAGSITGTDTGRYAVAD